jgi:hypothetical protein
MGHHQFSPSSFPARDTCAHFDGSEEENKNSKYGTEQHQLLEFLMKEDYKGFDIADADVNQRANAEWVHSVVMNYVDKEKMFNDVSVHSEKEVVTETSDFTYITGTADVIIVSTPRGETSKKCILIDAKFGRVRNYLGQMTVYALGLMQEHKVDEVLCVCAYGQMRKVDEDLIKKEDAVKYVDSVLDRVKFKHLEEKVSSEYCDWCKHQKTCSERLNPVKELKEIVPLDKKEILRGVNLSKSISELSSVQIGKVLEFADYIEDLKELLGDELLARMDKGEVVPGWKINERAGATKIADQQALLFELKTLRGITDAEIVEKSNLTVTAVKELVYGADAKKKATGEKFKEEFADFLKTESASRKVARIK